MKPILFLSTLHSFLLHTYINIPYISPTNIIHKEQEMAACVHNSRAETKTNRLSSPEQSKRSDTWCCKYSRPNSCNIVLCTSTITASDHPSKTIQNGVAALDDDDDDIWFKIREEAESDTKQEPILFNYYFLSILSHKSLESALANHLSIKLSNSSLSNNILFQVFFTVFNEGPEMRLAIREDIKAVRERDPACMSSVHCMLNFKGFLACQAHRAAHKLWSQGRNVLALVIQNRVSEVFAVDIHPGAKIGRGILLDHATGVVIGETAVIGDNVSILHNVTLGGTGKTTGDRHPKIGDGVLIGAGSCVLGNVSIGQGAKIGAGSVVLKPVPPKTTAVGNPARLLGEKGNPTKLDKTPGLSMDHIYEWSDYVI